MELFFQVFDKGVLEDGEGREIDFKNCVILLTSNVGTETFMKLCADPDTKPEPDGLVEAIRPGTCQSVQTRTSRSNGNSSLLSDFRRYSASDYRIAARQNQKTNFRQSRTQISLTTIRSSIRSPNDARMLISGARNVYNILTGTLLPEMSGEVLSRMASGEGIKKVHVTVGENENFVYDIT